jgi:hypothetical protein
VVVANGRLYGECVNVATRVQEAGRSRWHLSRRLRLRPPQGIAAAVVRVPG